MEFRKKQRQRLQRQQASEEVFIPLASFHRASGSHGGFLKRKLFEPKQFQVHLLAIQIFFISPSTCRRLPAESTGGMEQNARLLLARTPISRCQLEPFPGRPLDFYSLLTASFLWLVRARFCGHQRRCRFLRSPPQLKLLPPPFHLAPFSFLQNNLSSANWLLRPNNNQLPF